MKPVFQTLIILVIGSIIILFTANIASQISESETTCKCVIFKPGDINYDGSVDLTDFSILMHHWN